MERQELRDPLTGSIIGAAIEVHKALGPGLLESVYEECLEFELQERGHTVRRQVPVPLVYKGKKFDAAYRLDLGVDDLVILEIKAVDKLAPIHEAQLLTYLKLTGRERGLVLNFNSALLKDSIVRPVL